MPKTDYSRSHSFIFSGSDKDALRRKANELIEELEGAASVHPDVKWIDHEKASVITVGEIRSQLVNDMGVRPFREPYKIYIIDDAELLGKEAQNALLKTLEEPPGYGVIVLLTIQPDLLIPTVVSRAVTVYVTGDGQEEDTASVDIVLDILEELSNKRVYELDADVAGLIELAGTGMSYGSILEIFRKWFRDIAYTKENAVESLYYPEKIEYYYKDGEMLSLKDLFRAIDMIGELEVGLNTGVNAELALKDLLVGIRRLYNRE